MKIIFANGSELHPILVTGARRQFQGASRDALTFNFSASEDMNALDKAFSSTACETITIVGEDGTEAIYKAYTMLVELVKKPVEVVPASAESEAVWEDRILVTMAQRTYMETQIMNMEAAMTALLKGE
jgi:hypothetical protein